MGWVDAALFGEESFILSHLWFAPVCSNGGITCEGKGLGGGRVSGTIILCLGFLLWEWVVLPQP